MDHAAETVKQLTTLLAPQFNGLNTSVSELKDGIKSLSGLIADLTKVVTTATDDIKSLKEKQQEHTEKLEKLEETSNENAEGVKDYKRMKAFCIAGASTAIGILLTIGSYCISQYYDNKHHNEEMAYKRAMQESYTQLAAIVARLEKKVDSK